MGGTRYTKPSMNDNNVNTSCMEMIVWMLAMYRENENMKLQMTMRMRHPVDAVCSMLSALFLKHFADRSCWRNMKNRGSMVSIRYTGFTKNVFTAATTKFL